MRNIVACMCLATLVACSSSSPSEPGGGGGGNTNRNPVIASMSINPAFGMAFLTTFAFASSASDPDGDAVSYAWNIAGNSFTGSAGQVVFATGGNGTATLTVNDGRGGTASDSRTFVVGSMTGIWDVVVPFCSTVPFTLNLTQANNFATGNFNFPIQWCNVPANTNGVTDPAEPGLVTAAGNLDVRLKVGIFTDFYLRGVMAPTGRTITGGVFNSGFSGQPFTATKR